MAALTLGNGGVAAAQSADPSAPLGTSSQSGEVGGMPPTTGASGTTGSTGVATGGHCMQDGIALSSAQDEAACRGAGGVWTPGASDTSTPAPSDVGASGTTTPPYTGASSPTPATTVPSDPSSGATQTQGGTTTEGRCIKDGTDITTAVTQADCVTAGGAWTASDKSTTGASGTTSGSPGTGDTAVGQPSGTTSPAPAPSDAAVAPSDTTATPPTASDEATTASAGRREVLDVQRALNTQGQSIAVDGILGPKTRAALRKFQQDQGIQVTGQIDTETLQRLNVAH